MKFKHKVIHKIAKIIRKVDLAQYSSTKKDERISPPFKLVFFTGENGLDYLNASLISVYKFWGKLPEISIVSDGTPIENIRKGLIKWPKKVDIFSWEQCALSFKDKGNIHLYNYASTELIGKKLIGLLYCAQQSPILYSDSDVLWFNSPTEINLDFSLTPQIKMSRDIGFFYTKELLQNLNEEKCLTTTPFNSGVMFLSGDLTVFPKWNNLSEFLGKGKNLGWFSEQTTFAILNNFFGPDNFFRPDEVLIKVDDAYSAKYTRKEHPTILARHYVNVKATTFWRDFLFIFSKKIRLQ
jgi:hypothetical protein